METFGCIISLVISIALGTFAYYLSGSIVFSVLIVLFGGGYIMAKFMEGASMGSGYRQEQQNKEIIEELKKLNKDDE